MATARAPSTFSIFYSSEELIRENCSRGGKTAITYYVRIVVSTGLYRLSWGLYRLIHVLCFRLSECLQAKEVLVSSAVILFSDDLPVEMCSFLS